MGVGAGNSVTTTKVVDRQGGRCVEVRLGPMEPEFERWLMANLMSSKLGVAYVEVHKDTRKLTGYGVWEPWWENFLFWMSVAWVRDPECEYCPPGEGHNAVSENTR
jgi:hypothetical protein